MLAFTESVVEEATLDWFRELGYATLFGPDIAPGEPNAERANYGAPGPFALCRRANQSRYSA